MPKINVYLPDELADSVRAAGVPISVVCQQALEQAVRRVVAIREALARNQSPASSVEQLTEFTGRTSRVLGQAAEQATAAGSAVTTAGLLRAIVEDRANLAFSLLRSADVDLDALLTDLKDVEFAEPGDSFSPGAQQVIRQAVNEAISFGHNYVGCEHLLLAMTGTENDAAGRVLAAQGIDYRTLRRSVTSALTGYAHLRAQGASTAGPDQLARVQQQLEAAIDARLQPLSDRLTALEDAFTSGLGR